MPSSAGATFENRNPANTRDLIGSFPESGPEDIDAAVGAAEVFTGLLEDDRIDPIYEATVQATEEAIINAMLAAETMIGADDLRVPALPHDRLKTVLKKYGR